MEADCGHIADASSIPLGIQQGRTDCTAPYAPSSKPDGYQCVSLRPDDERTKVDQIICNREQGTCRFHQTERGNKASVCYQELDRRPLIPSQRDIHDVCRCGNPMDRWKHCDIRGLYTWRCRVHLFPGGIHIHGVPRHECDGCILRNQTVHSLHRATGVRSQCRHLQGGIHSQQYRCHAHRQHLRGRRFVWV